MLTHLETTHSDIDVDALNKNMESLHDPWEPAESLEPLWERGVKAQQLASAGGEPIGDAALTRIFHKVLKNSGVFMLDLRDWDDLPDAQKTHVNFKTHFTRANKQRLKNATSGQLHQAAGSAFKAIAAGSPTTPPAATAGPCVFATDGKGDWIQMFCCCQHLALVDRGANGFVFGDDVRVIDDTMWHVDVSGFDNHQQTDMKIVAASGLTMTQAGPVILIVNQGALHRRGKTIRSAIQMEACGVSVVATARFGLRQTLTSGGIPMLMRLRSIPRHARSSVVSKNPQHSTAGNLPSGLRRSEIGF